MKSDIIVLVIACIAITGTYARPLDAQYTSIVNSPGAQELHRSIDGQPAILSSQLRVTARERNLASASAMRGPLSAFAELEEVGLGDLGSANMVAGLEREFIPRAQRTAGETVASAELREARARLAGLRLSLGSRLDVAIIEAGIHRRILMRLADEDSLLRRAEVTLNSRFSVGQARYIDVIRLRTERLRVQADILEAQAETIRAMLLLNALSSREIPPNDMSSLTGSTLALPRIPTNVDSLIRAAPIAELLSARQLAATARIRVAQAQRNRGLTAALGVQRFAGEGGGSSFGPVLSGSITLPSWNGRSIGLAIESAQLDSAGIVNEHAAIITRIGATIRSATTSLDAARARISSVDQQLINAAREEREAALIAYANGDLSLAEFIDFERSLSRAEIQILQTYDQAIKQWDTVQQLLSGAALAAAEVDS